MKGSRVLFLGVCVGLVLVSVVLVALACGGETTSTAAPDTTAAPTTTGGGASAGDALYAQYCAECHADGVTGSVSEISDMTANGVGTMPGFADKLSAAEIAAVAEWAAAGGK